MNSLFNLTSKLTYEN